MSQTRPTSDGDASCTARRASDGSLIVSIPATSSPQPPSPSRPSPHTPALHGKCPSLTSGTKPSKAWPDTSACYGGNTALAIATQACGAPPVYISGLCPADHVPAGCPGGGGGGEITYVCSASGGSGGGGGPWHSLTPCQGYKDSISCNSNVTSGCGWEQNRCVQLE